MLFERVTPDQTVCNALLGLINETESDWCNVKSGSVTFDDFMAQDFPKRNVRIGDTILGTNNAEKAILNDRNGVVAKVAQMLGCDTVTNSIMYPPHSMMRWHTNSDDAGVRTYYTYTRGVGVFRYIDPETGNFVIDYDADGWTCRRFRISKTPPYLWHTVWSEGRRFAFGFNAYDQHS
jgi:hypothetical protein